MSPLPTAKTQRRAILATASMFAGALLFASAYVMGRTRINLQAELQPEDWRMSIRPPAGWSAERPLQDLLGFEVRSFVGPSQDRALRLRRGVVAPGTTAEDVCQRMLDQYALLVGPAVLREYASQPAMLGDWPGVLLDSMRSANLNHGGVNLILLTAVIDTDGGGAEAYSVEIQSTFPLSSRDRVLWRAVAASIRSVERE